MLDLPEGNAMRAPGEAPGMMALEIAMDEMAEKLGARPDRVPHQRTTRQVDPETARSARSRSASSSSACAMGARAFRLGRSASRSPAQVRDGRWLVGMGMAAAFRNNMPAESGARVRLDARGVVTVETDMTDIGTGSYTIIAPDRGRDDGRAAREGGGAAGRFATFRCPAARAANSAPTTRPSGVYAACVKLREAVAQKLGLNGADAVFADGLVRAGDRSVPLAEAAGRRRSAAEDTIEFGDLDKTYQQSTFGGHFVEVGVDAATGEIRVRRMLAVCAAGRILNPKTARSQVIGAMTMGVGAALMEELAVDKRRGFFVNHDLAGYEVPVHADIPHQEVIFLDETDPVSSPMKAKGVGELGLCGVAAAIANAVYNATGVRVRDYPVTLDKLIGKMPQAG